MCVAEVASCEEAEKHLQSILRKSTISLIPCPMILIVFITFNSILQDPSSQRYAPPTINWIIQEYSLPNLHHLPERASQSAKLCKPALLLAVEVSSTGNKDADNSVVFQNISVPSANSLGNTVFETP